MTGAVAVGSAEWVLVLGPPGLPVLGVLAPSSGSSGTYPPVRLATVRPTSTEGAAQPGFPADFPGKSYTHSGLGAFGASGADAHAPAVAALQAAAFVAAPPTPVEVVAVLACAVGGTAPALVAGLAGGAVLRAVAAAGAADTVLVGGVGGTVEAARAAVGGIVADAGRAGAAAAPVPGAAGVGAGATAPVAAALALAAAVGGAAARLVAGLAGSAVLGPVAAASAADAVFVGGVGRAV